MSGDMEHYSSVHSHSCLVHTISKHDKGTGHRKLCRLRLSVRHETDSGIMYLVSCIKYQVSSIRIAAGIRTPGPPLGQTLGAPPRGGYIVPSETPGRHFDKVKRDNTAWQTKVGGRVTLCTTATASVHKRAAGTESLGIRTV